jgi:hypothetical protein
MGCDAEHGSRNRDDGVQADAAMTYTAMVEGVECARFRREPRPWTCTERTLDEQCDELRGLGVECPWTIQDPRGWACSLSQDGRVELVCNTCGGVNVEHRYGWEGEVNTFSFSAGGELLGLIVASAGTSRICRSPEAVVGDPCPAAADSGARAVRGLCPNPGPRP